MYFYLVRVLQKKRTDRIYRDIQILNKRRLIMGIGSCSYATVYYRRGENPESQWYHSVWVQPITSPKAGGPGAPMSGVGMSQFIELIFSSFTFFFYPGLQWIGWSLVTLVRADLYLIYRMKYSSLSETTQSHTQKRCFIFSGKLTNNHHTPSRNQGQPRNDSSALLVIIV